MTGLRAAIATSACWGLLGGMADAAGNIERPVAALFNELAVVNGNKPVYGLSEFQPMLCFATDEAELPDLRKAHNRATRAQMAARRALIENAVASLAHNLVGAYRESGPSVSPIAIRVIGHADSDTAAHQPDYNARLSWQRALTIAKLLRADVAKFGGAYPPQLSFQIEGRSTFDPWPNRAAHCVTHAAAEMTADALAVPPI